jgi:hypothetical protein
LYCFWFDTLVNEEPISPVFFDIHNDKSNIFLRREPNGKGKRIAALGYSVGRLKYSRLACGSMVAAFFSRASMRVAPSLVAVLLLPPQHHRLISALRSKAWQNR